MSSTMKWLDSDGIVLTNCMVGHILAPPTMVAAAAAVQLAALSVVIGVFRSRVIILICGDLVFRSGSVGGVCHNQGGVYMSGMKFSRIYSTWDCCTHLWDPWLDGSGGKGAV